MKRILTLFFFAIVANLILTFSAQACDCSADSTEFFETVAKYNKEILEDKSERKPLTVVVATVKIILILQTIGLIQCCWM